MSKRLFPAFVYTVAFKQMLFIALMGINFKALDVFHGMARLPFLLFGLFGGAFLIRELWRENPLNPASVPVRKAPFHSAYLVVHLDIKQSPPVAVFVHIYSSSAKDMTTFGGEAKADLYHVRAEKFTEALREMEQIAPLYFPWVVPLMTRNR